MDVAIYLYELVSPLNTFIKEIYFTICYLYFLITNLFIENIMFTYYLNNWVDRQKKN